MDHTLAQTGRPMPIESALVSRSGSYPVSLPRRGLGLFPLKGYLCSVELIGVDPPYPHRAQKPAAWGVRADILFALAFQCSALALKAILEQAKASLRIRLYRLTGLSR